MAEPPPDLASIFLQWTWVRALLHRGWWLVTSVYLVTDADLEPSQLLIIGVAQGVVALVAEIPAGVVADTFSRRWSLIISHALMGTAMLTTGLVTEFGALVATQALWGLSWTFASGADVAWITDELDEPERISSVLVRSGSAQLTGAAVGIVGFGALAALTERSTAMVVAGMSMLLLGIYVYARFRETRFVPASSRRWHASWAIVSEGVSIARRSQPIMLMFAATFLVNGAFEANRLSQRRLIDIGVPSNDLVWFTVMGVAALLAGAVTHRLVERRIDATGAAQRGYVLACAAGALALIVLAVTPEVLTASAAIVVFTGIVAPLARTIGTIWVNRETSSNVRATVHSFLAQAEYTGEIACGLIIAAAARMWGIAPAFGMAAAGFVVAIVLVMRLREGEPSTTRDSNAALS